MRKVRLQILRGIIAPAPIPRRPITGLAAELERKGVPETFDRDCTRSRATRRRGARARRARRGTADVRDKRAARTRRRSCGDGRALRGRSIVTGRKKKENNRTAHFGSVARAGRARQRRLDAARGGESRYDGARLRVTEQTDRESIRAFPASEDDPAPTGDSVEVKRSGSIGVSREKTERQRAEAR